MSSYFGTPVADETLKSTTSNDKPMPEGTEKMRDYSIPAGVYAGVITDVETKTSGSGNKMTVVTVELKEGEHKGKSFKNFYVTQSPTGETLRGAEFLSKMLKDLKVASPKELMHQYCSLVLGDAEEYNGTRRNRVKWINRQNTK